MKKLLMTNLFFEKYTGSELHILEMAKLFQEKGYDVTIAVFSKGYPLLSESGTIKIIDCKKEPLTEFDFDIIFVQHFSVFDWLCTNYQLTYKHLIISKLSVINDFEHLPIYTEKADMILCVSSECAAYIQDKLTTFTNIPPVLIYPNCVTPDFFECYSPTPKHLKRIAVISNHIPDELIELSKLLTDISIDYIGMQYTPRRVNSELLSQYDLVITIGRTVQACFAAGIPVYVYDYLGGCGYLDSDNYELAERNNFSGRGFTKKSSAFLAEDIIKNYHKSINNLNMFHAIAKEKFNATNYFEKVYSYVTAQNSDKKSAEFYNTLEKDCIKTYSNLVPLAFRDSQPQNSQLYYDDSSGFSETHSISWNAANDFIIKKELHLPISVKSVRFDPCDIPCECFIYDILCDGVSRKSNLLPLNAYETNTEKTLFYTYDPQYYLTNSTAFSDIVIIYRNKPLSNNEIRNAYIQMQAQTEFSKTQYQTLKSYYNKPLLKLIYHKLFKKNPFV